MTPSRPIDSNSESHSSASSRSSVAGDSVSVAADRLERRSALRERRRRVLRPVPEQEVERDEDRGDLGGQLAHPALCRVEPGLHRVEVEDSVADDHDLAVEARSRRQGLADRRSSGKYRSSGRAFRDQSRTSPEAFSSRPRKPSHFGSYCQPSPAGSSRTSSASIGGKGIARSRSAGRSTGSPLRLRERGTSQPYNAPSRLRRPGIESGHTTNGHPGGPLARIRFRGLTIDRRAARPSWPTATRATLRSRPHAESRDHRPWRGHADRPRRTVDLAGGGRRDERRRDGSRRSTRPRTRCASRRR